MLGQTMSHYRITDELGTGGMGVVYQAEDLRLRRPVALKFLSQDFSAVPGARDRMVHEARAASRLNHENIATIYEVGEDQDTPFIAMELVAGETLKDALQRGLVGSFLDAIAFDENDVLYGAYLDFFTGEYLLATIDTATGVPTEVGELFDGIVGLAFDPADGQLYGSVAGFGAVV